MKIAINGTYVQKQASGLGVVTDNLINQLLDNPENIEFMLLSHANSGKKQYFQGLNKLITVSDRLAPDRGFSGHLARLLWYQTALKYHLKRHQADLFFSPANEGMLFPSIPQVITVHDLIPLKYPEVSPKWQYYYRYILPLILKRSSKIISVSQHTKKDLIETFGLSPESIEVVYNGYDAEIFFPQANPEILAKYNLDRYLLYVGDMRFYKNLDRCLAAFDRLPSQDYQFVITGKKDDFFYPKIKDKVKQLAAKERIIFLDYVPTADLPSLYSMAQCLVFASLYEGFGLPVLEAMACGCPVVASEVTSIPEVGGDSIFYVDPYEVDNIAQGMYRVLTNEDLHHDLSQRGKERAKLFSWDKTATQIKQLIVAQIN